LSPDWLRIGTDIIGTTVVGGTAPTFNMTFSLSGAALQVSGTPGQEDCHDVTISGLAEQFGSVHAAESALGFSSVKSAAEFFPRILRAVGNASGHRRKHSDLVEWRKGGRTIALAQSTISNSLAQRQVPWLELFAKFA